MAKHGGRLPTSGVRDSRPESSAMETWGDPAPSEAREPPASGGLAEEEDDDVGDDVDASLPSSDKLSANFARFFGRSGVKNFDVKNSNDDAHGMPAIYG